MNSAEDCSNKFISNQLIGAVIFMGIMLGNLSKKNGKTKNEEEEEIEEDENYWEKRNLNINFYH